MKALFNQIRFALASQDFLKAASLLKEIPMSMRTFRRQKIKRWGKYFAAGLRANVRGTHVRNPLIGIQMNAVHDAWSRKKFGAA